MNYKDRVTKAAVEAAISDGVANAIVCGSYTGDGQASRFIDLGFTPRAVLVISHRGRTCIFVDDYRYVYGGLILPGHPIVNDDDVVAAEIVEGGFRVVRDYTHRYFFCATNDQNNDYHYIALR